MCRRYGPALSRPVPGAVHAGAATVGSDRERFDAFIYRRLHRPEGLRECVNTTKPPKPGGSDPKCCQSRL